MVRMARIPTAQQVHRDGFGYRDDDGNWKVLIHYTVRPLPAPGVARRMAETFRHTPQFWLDAENRELVQAIDTNEAGSALRNLPGGVETNADRVIQVEVLGDEATLHGWGEGELEFVANAFAAPVAYPRLQIGRAHV